MERKEGVGVEKRKNRRRISDKREKKRGKRVEKRKRDKEKNLAV